MEEGLSVAWRGVAGIREGPDGMGFTDKFTVVLETAGLNATELSVYCRERGLFPELVERWRQDSQDDNEKPVLTLNEQKELEKLRAQYQREITRLKQELRRKEKALAEAAALLIAAKKIQASWGEDGDD
jgi:transposase